MISFFPKDSRYIQNFPQRKICGYGLFSSSARFDPDNQFLGDIYSFNDYFCDPGYGIPTHPHEFFEVVCLQISGRMHFHDFMGHDAITSAGSVHHFSSASGYLHSNSVIGEEMMRFVSIWIRPTKKQMHPCYRQRFFGDRMFSLNAMEKLITNAKDSDPQEALIAPVNVEIFGASVDTEGFSTLLHKADTALLYVVSGNILVDGINLQEGDHLRITDCDRIQMRGTPKGQLIIVCTKSE